MGDQAIALRASPFEQLSTPVAAPYRHLLIDVLRRPVEFALRALIAVDDGVALRPPLLDGHAQRIRH